MITPKVKALFEFINYLHSNIENFNRYNYLIDELDILYEKINELNPDNDFFDKKEFEILQPEIEKKYNELLSNTVNKIIQKAIDLNIYDQKRYASIYNDNKDEAFNIINVADDKDIPIILNKKTKYIEFRIKTRNAIFKQKDLYDKLDMILKVVFNFFDRKVEEEFNKLPRYEQIVVSNHTKHKRQMNNKEIYEATADFSFFQIEVIADLEFEGKTYKDVKQKNNDSILTPENWEQHKETFFEQKMATYKQSYTLTEKIKLELSALEKLPINKTDYQILKDRYKDYLEQKKTLSPQQSEKPKLEQKETELSEKIRKHFGFFNRNCPRKHKQILNDTDFNRLIEWTIYYFENDFEVPEISEPIEAVNTNKTFVQLAFKYLFKYLHKSSPYPETLFDFYQSAFNPYSEDKKSNFEAVKNNNEVKKLMQLDY